MYLEKADTLLVRKTKQYVLRIRILNRAKKIGQAVMIDNKSSLHVIVALSGLQEIHERLNRGYDLVTVTSGIFIIQGTTQ